MPRPGEHIHRYGPGGGIAQGGEPLYVPGQGGGIAGDIDHPFRGHPRHSGDDLLPQPLPGRVHHHHVRPQVLRGQVGGDLPRVSAEEFRVGHAVAPGVLPGVVDGLRNDLPADDPLCVLCQTQRNGPRPAVEVQHRLSAGEPRQLRSLPVQPLRLGAVHLVKGGDGQAEGQAAEGVLQGVLPPEGPVCIPQDHVGVPGVGVQHDPHRLRAGGPDAADQLLLPGQLRPVHHQADQGLPRGVGADVDMPQEAPARPLVVGGDI